MSDIVIQAENLSKQYEIGVSSRHDTLRDHLMHGFQSVFGRRRRRSEAGRNFWALKDVSFEVKQGEVIGIIGCNGAGKSTLLKILSHITEPTTGSVRIYGRLGSLLEIGTGFHPELTGRENIYLNGALLGMKKAEIKRKLEEIIAFAEIERFMDTPVKRYSSGMYVRLAFAVAAHLESEILILDEVLAVGDMAFQKKCLSKVGNVAKEGRTILFVSHNLQAISTLTQRSLLLSHGRCVYEGPTNDVITEYLRKEQKEEKVYIASPSSLEPKITRVALHTSDPNNTHRCGEPMEVHFEIATPVPIDSAALTFQAFNSHQQPVLHLLTLDSELPMCREPGIFQIVCRIPKVRLYIGHYSFTVHFQRAEGKYFQLLEGVCPFEIVAYGQFRESTEYFWRPGTCAYVEDCAWQISKKESSQLDSVRDR
jgi:lipopolysaccharide transport system ATP-binding protein